jgi:hypothetical protein
MESPQRYDVRCRVCGATYPEANDSEQSDVCPRGCRGGKDSRKKDVHECYARWAVSNNAPPLSQRKLTPLIEAKGFTYARGTGGADYWKGLTLLSDLEAEQKKEKHGGASCD